ncbi:MAG: asparagine synthase-related protein [Halioglobus sp.]|nr:asparagine synthase-related protein [Halioglobus sp.]
MAEKRPSGLSMNGVFGIINTLGGTVSYATLSGMAATVGSMPHDVADHRVYGAAGLGVCRRWLTEPVNCSVEGPAGSNVIFIGDIRLDNRDELSARLGLGDCTPVPDDGQLIVAAYAKWGAAMPDTLLGDFAFALWDSAKSELFMACDYLATCSLYYRRLGDLFVFANSISPLVSEPFSSPALDVEATAALLRDGEHYHSRRTLLAGVNQLPPGSSLTLRGSAERIDQYWSINDERSQFSGTAQEAVETLGRLLSSAVRSRVQTSYPVAAHLSGGLDSSAIIAQAAPLLGGQLRGYSWMSVPSKEQEREDPEWSTGQLLASTYQLPLDYCALSAESMLQLLTAHDLALGDTADLWSEHILRGKVVDDGARTLLSGWGGDQFITHYGNSLYAQRLLSGDALAVVRELRAPSLRRSLANLRNFLLLPLMGSLGKRVMPGYLGFASEEVKHLAATGEPLTTYSGVFVEREMRNQANLVHLCNRLRSWYAAGLKDGISYRYPLLDRRIVEFALSLPPQYFRWQGEGRYLLRTVMADSPPLSLWYRNQKAEPARVRDATNIVLATMRLWLHDRGEQLKVSRLVSTEALYQAIASATSEESLGSKEKSLRFWGMLRSILVLEMENRYSYKE